MYNVNITNARSNLYNLVAMAINDSELINISTKDGNAILISEEDFNAIVETLYLSSDAEYKKSLLEAASAPEEDFADEDDLLW